MLDWKVCAVRKKKKEVACMTDRGSRKLLSKLAFLFLVVFLVVSMPVCMGDEKKDNNVARISAGSSHTVGLKADGTVVATQFIESKYLSYDGQCDVSSWTNIVAVAAGGTHTVGLKADGTVVAVGAYGMGECDVDDYTDIVAVAAGTYITLGLKADGTVVAVGDNSFGQCNVDGWRDIVAVAAGGTHTVGLKADGTVVATKYTGDFDFGQCDVSGWRDIVAISAGFMHTVGLKADGTVVAVGYNQYGQCDVSGWTDIVAIANGYNCTVGLKADGTVVAVGINNSGQCNVGGWTDIVAVSSSGGHTVGLKADGTVVAVGDNENGGCNVSGWNLCASSKPTATAYITLEKGAKGDAVIALQERLNALGYNVGTADGDFGKKTYTAVCDFQRDNDLEATGIVDAKLHDLIFSDAAKTKAEIEEFRNSPEGFQLDIAAAKAIGDKFASGGVSGADYCSSTESTLEYTFYVRDFDTKNGELQIRCSLDKAKGADNIDVDFDITYIIPNWSRLLGSEPNLVVITTDKGSHTLYQGMWSWSSGRLTIDLSNNVSLFKEIAEANEFNIVLSNSNPATLTYGGFSKNSLGFKGIKTAWKIWEAAKCDKLAEMK